MVDDMERLFFSPAPRGSANFLAPGSSAEARTAAVVMFKQNWKSVKLRHHRLAKLLLVRIARKREELEAAKDNASYPPPSHPSCEKLPRYLHSVLTTKAFHPSVVIQRYDLEWVEKVGESESVYSGFHCRNHFLSAFEFHHSKFFLSVCFPKSVVIISPPGLIVPVFFFWSLKQIPSSKTLFTLELFDWNDPGQIKSFVTTLFSVAASTYVFSGLLIWFIRQPLHWKTLEKVYRDFSLGLRLRWSGFDMVYRALEELSRLGRN